MSIIKIAKEEQLVPTPELPVFVIPTNDMYEGIFGLIRGASDTIDPLLLFDILVGFVTCFDYVFDDLVIDLSIYKYFSISYDDVSLLAPYSPTSHILDIDDEIAQHDLDERATPTVGNVEIIDFRIAEQPRELKIGSPLSTDEKDNLIYLLRSYLNVFPWSYEDMLGLNPSIIQHHLPILPHARPVKHKLR